MMNIRPLTPALAEKAAKEFGESPQRLAADVESLRAWIAKQPHLHNNVRIGDQWLANILRGCKYSMETAKRRLEMFYTLRYAFPDLRTELDPCSGEMKKMLDEGLYLLLPETATPDGPRIVMPRVGLGDPKKISTEDIFRLTQIIALYCLMEDDNAVISGVSYVIDVTGTTTDIMRHLSLRNIKKLVLVGEEALPIRHKVSHYINTPIATETIFGFLKTFIKPKHQKRFFIHRDTESLYDHIPKSILPIEYGGDKYTMQEIKEDTKNKIQGIRDFYLEDMKYVSDESKRPGKPTTAETLFGVDGSFRQLEVD